jgi:hypothetical protein
MAMITDEDNKVIIVDIVTMRMRTITDEEITNR